MKVLFDRGVRLKTSFIEIPLTNGVSWICGDSNTGKTFLFNQIRNSLKQYKGKDIVTIDYHNYKLIRHINEVSNTIFVIDQFDAIRLSCPECVEILNNHYDPVIIFGRASQGVRVPVYYIFELKLDNNEMYLSRLIGNERV